MLFDLKETEEDGGRKRRGQDAEHWGAYRVSLLWELMALDYRCRAERCPSTCIRTIYRASVIRKVALRKLLICGA